MIIREYREVDAEFIVNTSLAARARHFSIEGLSGDAPHSKVIFMTHAEEIARATFSIIKKKRGTFARVDIRKKLGLSAKEWLSGYTAIFQGMTIDHPGGTPNVGSKFKGVFKNVGYGIYELTEYGEKLIKEYDC